MLGGLTAGGVVVAWLPAVACGVVAWFADAQYDACDDVAKDPPRFDYEVLAKPASPRFYPEAFGDSPLESITAEAGHRALAAAANVKAFVRTLERAAGAMEREAFDAATDQFERGRSLAQLSAASLKGLPSQIDRLAGAIEEDDQVAQAFPEGASPGRVRSGMVADQLPAESLALLYRAGVPLRLMRQRVGRPTTVENPLRALTAGMRRAAAQGALLGEDLARWTPPSVG